jgi:hypothetical protein
MLGIEHKQHFGESFLPALETLARSGQGDLAAFVDESLSAYGSEPRALVVDGMASWLAITDLPDELRGTIADLFGL